MLKMIGNLDMNTNQDNELFVRLGECKDDIDKCIISLEKFLKIKNEITYQINNLIINIDHIKHVKWKGVIGQLSDEISKNKKLNVKRKVEYLLEYNNLGITDILVTSGLSSLKPLYKELKKYVTYMDDINSQITQIENNLNSNLTRYKQIYKEWKNNQIQF
jgi:hypothetical protein